jgi:uncharacterized protein YjdB
MQEIRLSQNTFSLFPSVYAVQNDTGRELKMVLTDQTLLATDMGALAVNRSDGSYYTISGTVDTATNSVTADISQALTQPGRTFCQLKITDTNDLVVSSYTFCIMVQPSTDGVPQEQLGVTAQELMAAAAQLTLSDNDVKTALLQIAEKVVYIDPNGQDYYDALEDALFPPVRATGVTLDKNSLVFSGIGGTDTLTATVSPNNVEDPTVYWGSSDKSVAVVSDGIVTAVAVGTCTITATCGTKHASASVNVASATLLSISAVYTQSGTVTIYTPLNDLKTDLVVTAYYDDNTSEVVPAADYTLSGTLTAGTSTITVTYGDKTDTFTVSVTDQRLPSGYTEYEYIKISGSGAGAIRTPAQLSTGYVVETAFGFTGSGGNPSCIMGTRVGNSGAKQFGLFVTPTTKKVGYWINGTDTANTYNLAVGGGAKNTVVYKPKGVDQTYPNNSTLTINGTVCNTGDASATNVTLSAWLGFYKYQTSATASYGTNYDIGLMVGETVVKDLDDNVIYDFVPCYDGTYYGLYETVGGAFYYDTSKYSYYSGGNWS